MKIRIYPHINRIPADEWNALVKDNNPFLRHEFLHAMEQHECVGEKFGWLPRHIAVYNNEKLVGAMPLYEKYNSYGEFVFDHAWADAYQRSGRDYYPKLVSAIPYTPATGQRLLAKQGVESEIFPVLLQTARQLTQESDASGLHILFPFPDEHEFLEQQGLLTRHDCQFHWHNHEYKDFDDFLAKLSSRKRKNIIRERRKVTQSGVNLRVLDGHTASRDDWEYFARFYDQTFEEKWGIATFNLAFFTQIAQDLPDAIVLVLAELEGRTIAGSLMYRSDTTLFGRHWGCVEQVDQLHFEACYYQGIEYCIKHGLQLFEPGAQGEHKISRGFVPTRTLSSHWLVDKQFQQVVANHVAHERNGVAHYIEQMSNNIPYKKSEKQT